MKRIKLLLSIFVFMLLASASYGAVNTSELKTASEVYYSVNNADVSGSTILDLTPNNYDITNNGGTTGVVGILNEAVNLGTRAETKYLKLDGQTFDFVRTTGNFYISLWWKPNNYLTNNYNYLIGSGRAGSGSHTGWELSYEQRSSQGSPQRLQFRVSGSSAYNLDSSNYAITSNDWHHIFIAGDGTTAKMYINNVEVQSSSIAISTGTSTYPDFYVGAIATVLSSGQGQFDEISIGGDWSTAGTAQELATYFYNSDAPTVNQQYPYYSATLPSFLSYNISNSAPIRTNDIIDVNFKLEDLGDETNVSLTWFKSDDNSTWTAHTTDDETFTNVTLNTTINSNAQGDLEADDTTAFEYWKAQLTATSSGGTTAVNTSEIYIKNDAPQIASSTSGTTNNNPADKGDQITFSVTGTDVEEDTISLRICSNPSATWNNCTLLAENLNATTWSSVTNTTISANYTTTEDTRNNTGYAIVYDGGNSSSTNISYYVNQYPTLDTFTSQDTTGDTTYYFKESMDYFRINMNDSYDGTNLTPKITVYDPDDVVKVNNQDMTLQSGTTFQYGNDLYLDAIGTWNVSITVTDSDGATTNFSQTFEVQSSNSTTLGRIYSYDVGDWTNYSIINESIQSYGYYAVELHINNSIMENNWTEFKNTVEQVKNASQLVIITLDDDLSNNTRTINNLNSTYSDLIGGNYLNGILMLKVQSSATNTTTNTEVLNNITKKIYQETNNNFPIYVRDYTSTQINENYAVEDIYSYISTNNRTEYIDEEINLLRTSTDKSRFYENLTDTFKGYARDWQNDVIDNLRSGINTSTTYSNNIAELNNYDLIVANNQSTSQTFTITSVDATNNKDIYDLTDKSIIETDTDKTFNVTIQPYSANILYFTDLSKLVVNEDDEINLFGSSITEYPKNVTYGGPADEAFLFVSGSSNPDDGRIFMTDPTFNEMDFYVWYGTNGFEAIADWERYNKIIIADDNETWVDSIVNQTSVFGYVAVEDYGNNNEPDGCTSGVNCTSWNRTKWLNTQKAEIDVWTDMNSQTNVFIDGLDIGDVNDVDGLFDDSLVELSDYVRVTKQRELMLNTYTAYQDFANLGDYTMRESACGRWDGTENDPTYSYEDLETEKQRAEFHRTHNIPVMAQTFGNITDYEKSYYCFMQTKVLYGDLASYSYNQPLFDYTGADDDYTWNFYKYPDLGTQLEDTYTENGDLLTRRFENGIVTVNTSSKEVDFENNLQVNELTHCAWYYDNDDGGNDEGFVRYVINDNISKAFNVVDTDLTAFEKTWKCADIPTEYYEPSGFYELEFYYIDSDGSYIGNSGLYLYHGDNSSQDKLSSWEQTLNDHPSNNEEDYWQYDRGDNWAMQLHINATAEKTIDDVTNSITRTETGTEVRNVTFTSTSDWDLPVYDKQVFLNKTQFNEISVNGTQLNVNYDSSCNTNSPTYNTTEINGYNWSACYYNATGGGYNFNVIVPHLSTQTYLVDGNTYPTVDNQSIFLNNLLQGNQNLTISFNVSDADNNTISACKVAVDGTMKEGTYNNGTCTVTLSTYLNSTSQTFTPYVYDEYDGNGTGTNYSSFTSVFDSLTWDNQSTTSNQSIQYFWNRYNLTYDWEKSFSNISWSINSSINPVNINLSNGTNQERFEKNYSLVSLANYSLIRDENDIYYVNNGETIWRLFNLTNDLGSTLPEFNLSFDPKRYSTGTQTLEKYNGSSWNTENFTSGNPIIFSTGNLSNGSTSEYNISHQSKVIYTTNDTLTYTQSGDTRTYYWNSSDGLGLKYNFMFSELLDTTNSIFHNIAYSEITNWDSKTSTSNTLRDDQENSLVQGSDYTLTDQTSSDLLVLNWAPLTGDEHYRFNLSYTAEVISYECNDGIDNDGDGDIDYPDDAGCSSETDDSENSETSDSGGSSGGGGGGGSSGGSTSGDEEDLSSGKQVCDVFISPKDVELNDAELLEDLTIRNEESFGFDPQFDFTYTLGNEDLIERLRMTNEPSLIDSGRETVVGVRLSTFLLPSGTASGKLVVSSSQCVDIEVPIDITIEQESTVSQIGKEFENKSVSDVVVDLSEKSFVGNNKDSGEESSLLENVASKIFSVMGLIVIISVIIAITLIPTSKDSWRASQNQTVDIGARFVIWLFSTGIIGILIWVVHIMFFGSG